MTYTCLSFTETFENIIETIFNEVYVPIIRLVFDILLKYIKDVVLVFWQDLLLSGYVVLLKVVNFFEQMFDIFSGTTEVTYNGKPNDLLSIMFQLNGVSKVLGIITVIATVMAFIFAIYSTLKHMSDSVLEDGSPITDVLKNGFKSAVTFMLVPLLCVCLLQLSSMIIKQIDITFNYAGNAYSGAGMDDVLFITSAAPCANSGTNVQDFALNNRYWDVNKIKESFDESKINLVSAYVTSILVIVTMFGACIIFIKRVFELLVLYLVSPFFSASIALDGGAHFAKWRDLFVAKFFSGFGSIITMKLYILVSPVLVSSDLKFSGDGDTDLCIKMAFLIGGAWAVFKGQGTILQILNPEIAAQENQTAMLAVGMISGGVNTAVGFATGGASSIMTSMAGGVAGGVLSNDNKSNSSGGGGGGSGMPSMSGSSKEQAYKGK